MMYTFQYKNKNKITYQKRSHPKRFLLWIFLGVEIVLQVFFTVSRITSGSRIKELEKKINTFGERNSFLENELLKSSSLLKLEESAETLGFIKPKDRLYVRADESFTASLK